MTLYRSPLLPKATAEAGYPLTSVFCVSAMLDPGALGAPPHYSKPGQFSLSWALGAILAQRGRDGGAEATEPAHLKL